jgi:hypothetical protein
MTPRRVSVLIGATLALPGCLTCGDGTHEEDGVCVLDAADTDADADADSDSDTDADTDTDADSDADTDTDADTDVEPPDPCAPPDAWTGAIDPTLYTSTPYAATYDANIDAITPNLYHSGGSSSSTGPLVLDATIVAVEPRSPDFYGGNYKLYYVADANATLAVFITNQRGEVGDKVSFSAIGTQGYAIDETSGWTWGSAGNPVAVTELGSANLDYAHFNRMTHVWGRIDRVSNADCGRDQLCFVFEHDGTVDRIRVPADNTFGLDQDYGGGLCGEVVAPEGVNYDEFEVPTHFVDVRQPEWMRVWEED